jgi:hypothetical protein
MAHKENSARNNEIMNSSRSDAGARNEFKRERPVERRSITAQGKSEGDKNSPTKTNPGN